MPTDRRTLIRRGLLGGAVLSVFGGATLALKTGERPPLGRRDLRILDEGSFWVLAAVAARITPAEGAEAAALAEQVDHAMRVNTPAAQRDFVRALYLLENALPGLLFRGSTTVFTELPAAAQDEALLGWRDSRLAVLRSAYHSFRRLVLGAWYADPARAAAIGYPGPRWDKPAPPPMKPTKRLSPPWVPKPIRAPGDEGGSR